MSENMIELIKRIETKVDDLTGLYYTKDDNSTINDKIENLQERIEELEELQSSVEEKHEELDSESNSKLDDLDSRLDSLEVLDLENKIEVIDDLKSRLDIFQKKFDLLFNIVGGLERRFIQSMFNNHDFKVDLIKLIQTHDIKFQDLIKGEFTNN